jgi:hypothetical protein
MLIVEQKLQEISASAVYQPFALPKPAKQRKQASPFVRGMIFLGMLCLVIGGFIGGGIGNTITSATNQARANASATAEAVAQAHAAATVTALQKVAVQEANNYGIKGALALADPLSQPGEWQPQADTNFGGSCQFQNGALQITQSPSDKFYECDEGALFKNFIFQVNMTITQGNCGGITFRESNNGQNFYKFEVCADGTYALYLYTSASTSETKTLKEGTATLAIHVEQENTIAIVANGNTFDLYLNNQKIDSASDSSYSIGTIGLVAHASDNDTTVNYQDAIIWALP